MLVGIRVRGSLSAPLTRSGTVLELDATTHGKLLDAMRDRDYTYGTITLTRGSSSIEVVKLSLVRGSIVLERGLDGTVPGMFPVGSCFDTAVTHSWVKDYVCQTCPD